LKNQFFELEVDLDHQEELMMMIVSFL